MPDLAFAFYDQMVIFDHIFKTAQVVVTARVTPDVSARDAYQQACDRVDGLVTRLATVGVSLPLADIAPEAVALKVDPDADAADDVYADPQYQVPDDLVW